MATQKSVSLLTVDEPAGYVDLPCPDDPSDPEKVRRNVPVRKISAGAYALAQRLAAGEGTIDDRAEIMRRILPTATEAELAVLTDAQMTVVSAIAVKGVDAVLAEIAEGNGEAPPVAGQPTAPHSPPATGSATSSPQ